MSAADVRHREDLILKLFEIGAVKFGSYKLKTGLISPVYFDLRVIISFPEVLMTVSNFIWDKVKCFQNKYSVICGVPYTALPIATCVSTSHNIPMLIRRKEGKDYGTQKIIEGYFETGSNCLVIEDVVTSGSSVWETAVVLQQEGLNVSDAVVLLDREQGGKEMLKAKGITLHTIFSMSDILKCLHDKRKITDQTVLEVKNFLTNNNTYVPPVFVPGDNSTKSNEGDGVKCYRNSVSDLQVSYEERGAMCTNEIARKIFQIITKKQTNLCLSADVESEVELLELADLLGPHICILKTHIDILDHVSPGLTGKLKEIASKHNFVIFEDRKFADIGNTVKKQYSAGVFAISEWAEMTNAHSVPGPGIIEGLKASVKGRKDRACLLIAEMSSKGNLATKTYTEETVKMAEQHEDFVIGFISTSQVSTRPEFLHITPGVRLEPSSGHLGQQYLTPEEVIYKRKCDVIVVGSGITMAANRLQAALDYKLAGWKAYMDRLLSN